MFLKKKVSENLVYTCDCFAHFEKQKIKQALMVLRLKHFETHLSLILKTQSSDNVILNVQPFD